MPTDLNFSQPQYSPPPPPPKSNVWKWVLGGCGGLTLLGMIGIFASLKLAMNNPEVKKAMETAASAPEQSIHLDVIRTALNKYRSDHDDAYPKSLDDLVGKYLRAEDVKEKGHGKYLYKVPAKDASNNTAVVSSEPSESTMFTSQILRQYHLLKDGRIVMDQTTRTDVRGSKYR